MNAADEASAEAVRRWPIYSHGVTDTRDIPVIERGRDCFVDGAEWQASRDSAELTRLNAQLAEAKEHPDPNNIWTKAADDARVMAQGRADSLAVDVKRLTAQLQAAQDRFSRVRYALMANADTSAHDTTIRAANTSTTPKETR